MRILLDACLAYHVSQAMQLLGVDAKHVRDIEGLGASATDTQIFEWLRDNPEVIFITADKAQKRRSHEAQQMRSFRLGVFFVTFDRNHQPSRVDQARAIIYSLPEIDLIQNSRSRPYLYEIKHPRLSIRPYK